MTRQATESPELQNLGPSLILARRERGLSQAELAARSGLSQAQISYFELGQRRPTLDQLLKIAQALGCSLQKVLSGSNRTGTRLSDIALQLRDLGLVDLWVRDPIVPAAFRASEEVIALAVSGSKPEATHRGGDPGHPRVDRDLADSSQSLWSARATQCSTETCLVGRHHLGDRESRWFPWRVPE